MAQSIDQLERDIRNWQGRLERAENDYYAREAESRLNALQRRLRAAQKAQDEDDQEGGW